MTGFLPEELLPACSVLPLGGLRALLARLRSLGLLAAAGAHVPVTMGPGIAWGASSTEWTCKPFLLNGNPVEVTTAIRVVCSFRK